MSLDSQHEARASRRLRLSQDMRSTSILGPPVERLEEGQSFSVVYFSREPSPKKGKRALLGDLASE